ncbi:MAG: hypothetical protein OSB00_15220 [Sphingomonas bacterium]|nr:hypothetical protein [Sphingomonas bacterium]
MREFTFSDLNRSSGDILDRALSEPVGLRKRGKRKIVMVPSEAWDRLSRLDEGHQAHWVDQAPEEDLENLMAGFQELIDAEEHAGAPRAF